MKLLVILSVMFFLSLSAPSVWAAGAVNAFSLDLVRLWTPDTLAPSYPVCRRTGDDRTLQRTQVWLERSSGHDPHVTLHQGVLACLRGDAEQAVEAWKKDGDCSLATLFVAIASFGQGHVLETSLAKNFGDYGYGSGVWYERNGNAPAAISWYSFSLAYEPSVRTASKLARLYQAQGAIVLAEETWQRLAAVFPMNDPDHWEALGQIAELEKDWPAAAKAYQQEARLVEPKSAYSLWLRSGNMWLRAKAYGKAEEIFLQALALDPRQVDAYLRVGEVFRYQQRYDEAIDWYRKAQKLAPDSYAPLYYLGLVAYARKHYTEARSYFEESLVLKPGDPGVLYHEALSLKALGRRSEAIEALEKSLSQQAKPPESWQTLLKEWKAEDD